MLDKSRVRSVTPRSDSRVLLIWNFTLATDPTGFLPGCDHLSFRSALARPVSARLFVLMPRLPLHPSMGLTIVMLLR